MAKSTEKMKKRCIGFFSSCLSLIFIFLTFIEGFAEFNHANADRINPNVSISNTLTNDDVLKMEKSRKELKRFVKSKIKNPENVKVSSKISNKISKNDKITKNNRKINVLKKLKPDKQTDSESSNWFGWVLGGVLGLATLVGKFFLIRKFFSKSSTNPINSFSNKQKSNTVNNKSTNNNIVINNLNVDDNNIIANDSNAQEKSTGNVSNYANNIRNENSLGNNFTNINDPVNGNNIFEDNHNLEKSKNIDNIYLEDDDTSDIIISSYGNYNESDSRIIENSANRINPNENNENIENSSGIENVYSLDNSVLSRIMSNYGDYSESDFQIIDGPINGYNESGESTENQNNIEDVKQPWDDVSVELDYSEDAEPKFDGSIHLSRIPSFETIYISQNPSI